MTLRYSFRFKLLLEKVFSSKRAGIKFHYRELKSERRLLPAALEWYLFLTRLKTITSNLPLKKKKKNRHSGFQGHNLELRNIYILSKLLVVGCHFSFSVQSTILNFKCKFCEFHIIRIKSIHTAEEKYIPTCIDVCIFIFIKKNYYKKYASLIHPLNCSFVLW